MPVLIVVSAVVVFLAGWRLAREETVVRVERDRAPLEGFAEELGRELVRLEELYESHLRRLARQVKRGDEFAVRDLGEAVSGVRQISILRGGGGPKDWHVEVLPERDGLPAQPTFDPKAEPLWEEQESVLLDREAILVPFGPESGWVDQLGRPLFYWYRRGDGNEVVVTLVERVDVAASMDGWVRDWIRGDDFDPFTATEGVVELRGPTGEVVDGFLWGGSAEGAAEGRPHFLLPVRSRFGDWEVAAWDVMETRVAYATPVLVGGGVLALLLAGVGLAAWRRQREAMRQAEQRVSFVNQVSHELRTPLTNIMLNSDLAADEATATGERRRRLGLIRDEAGRLSRMIGNVLTFARGERGQLELRPVRCVPDEVVGDVLAPFESALGRREIRVERKLGANAVVKLDRDALAQVLANLVSNVEKYGKAGGRLEVETRWEGEELSVVVRDDGPGIAAGMEEKIFRPFQRVGSSVKEGVSGAGLGLAIARDLAERMGGTLVCEGVASGASFCLRVPAVDVPGNIVDLDEAVGE